MKKTFFLLAVFLFMAFASAQSFVRNFYDEGIAAYHAGDLKAAKELLSELEYKNDAKSRLADFILATIAASEADLLTAKIRFPRALENPPQNYEQALLQNFSKFADANRLYDFEIELLAPFYEKNPVIFEKNSMAMYRYARALYETGKKDEASALVKRVWEIFRDDASADACDFLIFEDDLNSPVVSDLKATLFPLSNARLNAMKGNLAAFEFPENSSLGLAIWAFENNKATHDDLEDALERHSESQFAWNAWYVLGAKSFEDGLHDLAHGFAEKSISLAPDDILLNWHIFALKGDALRFLKNYEEAREAYKKVYMNRLAPGEAVAECIYKTGLSYYEEKNWNAAYFYFERVFVGYNGFDHWSSRSYYYGARSRLEAGDNLGARNILREYIKYSKHRDTQIFHDAQVLFTNIKIR